MLCKSTSVKTTVIYITVVFTEVDLHSMIKLFPNIGIKRHKMPVTDWLYITRYVRIYHLHINMTCGTHQFNPFDWCLRAYICKLNKTYVILSSTHNSIEQDDVLFVLLANNSNACVPQLCHPWVLVNFIIIKLSQKQI